MIGKEVECVLEKWVYGVLGDCDSDGDSGARGGSYGKCRGSRREGIGGPVAGIWGLRKREWEPQRNHGASCCSSLVGGG